MSEPWVFNHEGAGKLDDDFDAEGDQQGRLLPEDMYLCAITEVDAPDEDSPYIQAVLTVKEGVLTKKVRAGNEIRERMTLPSEEHKDGGQFCRKKILIFLIATKQITESDYKEGKGANPIGAIGQEVIVRYKHRSYKNADGEDREGGQVDGLHIYAEDDPRLPELTKKYLERMAKASKSAKRDEKYKKF